MRDGLYPKTLLPDHKQSFIIGGNSVRIPAVSLEFRRWEGASIGNTFGGKPLVNFAGKPVFAELAIMHTAILGGWKARWVETYSMKAKIPYYFSEWSDDVISLQKLDPITDKQPAETVIRVAQQNKNSYYGCWDVLAWRGARVIFMESKRTKKDSVRITQLAWVEAALRAGLTLDNFLIVQWDFQ